jgi:transposase InsO family protein
VGFLVRLPKGVPYRIHTVLTDHGIQFADRAQDRWDRSHLFDRYGVEQRRTRPNHPGTNGQVELLAYERMDRMLKEATVRRYHYERHAELREHLKAFLVAYNFSRRLKMLRGLTPYEFVCAEWERSPKRFVRDPSHDTLGLYISILVHEE